MIEALIILVNMNSFEYPDPIEMLECLEWQRYNTNEKGASIDFFDPNDNIKRNEVINEELFIQLMEDELEVLLPRSAWQAIVETNWPEGIWNMSEEYTSERVNRHGRCKTMINKFEKKFIDEDKMEPTWRRHQRW